MAAGRHKVAATETARAATNQTRDQLLVRSLPMTKPRLAGAIRIASDGVPQMPQLGRSLDLVVPAAAWRERSRLTPPLTTGSIWMADAAMSAESAAGGLRGDAGRQSGPA